MMGTSWFTVIAIFVFSSIYCIVSHPKPELWFQELFPLKMCPANASMETFYGIMFDAGSTGTRIHIYTFIQRSPGKTVGSSPGHMYFGVESARWFYWLTYHLYFPTDYVLWFLIGLNDIFVLFLYLVCLLFL